MGGSVLFKNMKAASEWIRIQVAPMKNNNLHGVDWACDVSEVLPFYISDLIELLEKQTPCVQAQTAGCSDKGPDAYLAPVSHWCNPITSSHSALDLLLLLRLVSAQSFPVKTRREKNSKERGKGSIFHLTPCESWLPCGMWYLFPLLAPFPIMPLTSEVTCHWKMKLWINREDPVVSLISRFCLKSPGGVLNYSSTGALCELHVSVTCPPFACPFVSEGGILGNLIRDHRFRLQKWNKRGNWLY